MRSKPALSALLAFTLVLGGWVGSAGAKDVVLVMKDGRRINGELVSQNDDNVVIKINNISTPFPKAGIQRIEEKKSLPELVAEWRQGVAPNELDKRFALARKIFDHKPEGIPSPEVMLEKYQLAAKEARDILKINSNHEQAKLLLDAANLWIDHYQKQIRRVDDDPVPPNGDDDDDKVKKAEEVEIPKLDDKQVNWLRLFEYDFRERSKPRVEVPNDVLDQLFDKHATDPRVPKGNAARSDLRRKAGFEKLDLLFQVQDRDLWGQAEVRGDPQAFRTFKNNIHRNYVLSYCATAECHGGANGGKLLLSRDRPTSDETVYTNFYILNQTQGPMGSQMIDRNQPTMSLLIQYGLPTAQAAIRHPDVSGWMPNPAMATGERSRMYRQLLDWIGKELYTPTPRYSDVIDYKVKTGQSQAKPPAEDAAPKANGAAEAPENP